MPSPVSQPFLPGFSLRLSDALMEAPSPMAPRWTQDDGKTQPEPKMEEAFLTGGEHLELVTVALLGLAWLVESK